MINHISILKDEIIRYLCDGQNINNPYYFADLTFGGGGHSFALSKKILNLQIKATDKDPDIIEKSKSFFQNANIDNIELVHSDFNNFPELVEKNWQDVIRHGGFNGILMDLGISSYQIDNEEKGFSFRFNAPLDMRMNYSDDGITAWDIVNNFSEKELADILFEFGGERFSRRIAENIVAKRKENKINTTKELENIIYHSYPRKLRFNKTHPATKSFQALRIVVNDEMNSISNTLEKICKTLKLGGVITVLTFHSLEDRIVKNIFKDLAMGKEFRLIEKKAIKPSQDEINSNPRSRSAKLRILRREA